MKPLGKKVTIRPRTKEEKIKKTSSPIILLEDNKKEMTYGTVLDIGSEVTKVEKGDKVLFSPFHFDEIKEDLYIIEEKDIWAITD